MKTDAAQVGFHGLRNLRSKRKPSERLSRKVSETYEYFLRKVDPIMGYCLTRLLSEQPPDIISSLLNYLDSTEPGVSRNRQEGSRRELKVFLATRVAPIMTALSNKIAAERPDDVVKFLQQELIKMKSDLETAEKAKNVRATHDQSAGERHVQLAVLGLNNAGKSTILNALQGKFDGRPKPTVGFRPVTMMLSEETKIRFYDLGGGKKIRDIWKQYYHDVHGLIYVFDGAAALDEFETAVSVFSETISHPFLIGKPVLVLVNKQDVPHARSEHDVAEVLRPLLPIEAIDKILFACCSASVPDHLEPEFQTDPRIEAALLHVLDSVLGAFDELNERVRQDSLRKTAEEAQQRVAKERKVLKNKIACAFLPEVDSSFVAAMQIEAEPENVFSVEEGITYLASEVGEDVESLHPTAVELAGMVGYHKLALTIVGGLRAPVSKKKVPMEWDELKQMVIGLRQELGLHKGS